LLVAAFILALLDLVIAYALRGLLRRRPVGVAAGLLLALMVGAPAARAGRCVVVKATSQLRLAYIRTGSQAVDAESRAGMLGLADTLNRRTAVETAEPLAVDPGGRRSDLLSAALLAGHGRAANAVAACRRAHQPVSRNRWDDPVRHPRRRRGDAGAVWQRRRIAIAAAPARRGGQDSAAGSSPA